MNDHLLNVRRLSCGPRTFILWLTRHPLTSQKQDGGGRQRRRSL